MSDLADRDDYLFLMRHAEHDGGHLTANGSAHVQAVSARFAEWILAEWRDQGDRRLRIWHTTTVAEVQQTVDLLIKHLVDDAPRRSTASRLLPSAVIGHEDVRQVLSAYAPTEEAFNALWAWLDTDEIDDRSARGGREEAPLLVGNDPLIGWLASALVGSKVPVARGELLCLVRPPTNRGRWRLLWTISEDREPESEAIRAKIKSKMTTAAALGTVIVGLTTFLLQNALQDRPSAWQWFAFGALGWSAGLYFAALFLYDSLQMPTRFWGSAFPSGRGSRQGARSAWQRLRHGQPSVQRPPSSAARVLQASMLRIWTWIFTPATILAGLGVASLAISATPSARGFVLDIQPWQAGTAIVALVIIAAGWVAWHRPNLGASD